jgi:hypothetical protein
MRLRECAPNLFRLERTKLNVTFVAYVAAKRFEVRKCCVCEKAFPDPDVFGLWESFSKLCQIR